MKFLPFNQNNRKTQYGVAAFLILLILSFATQCARSAEPHFQFGAGGAIARGEAASVSLTAVLPDVVRDADIEIGATLIGESTYDNQPQRNNFAWHATAVDALGPLEVGLGAAYLQNTDRYNGSNLNFHLLLGYKFQRLPITIRVQHFSNAGTRMPNLGRDMLLLIYRF